MSSHTLVGHLGTINPSVVANEPGRCVTHVLLADVDGRLAYGLADVLKDLNELGVPATDVGIDLLLLATLVHAADTRIARDSESQDAWTREFKLVVPVSDCATWDAARPVLEKMLCFLSGDLWRLEFAARPTDFTIALGGKAPKVPKSFTHVSLFSGGLDSLIGAVDALEAEEAPLFVSHASDGATSQAQKACFQSLAKHYASSELSRLRAWISFPKEFVTKVKPEDTTRGRSFLFIALGIAAGSGLGHEFVLDVPENGLIALNVPLDLLRLGSLSTRTTHPFYLARWNELLSTVGITASVQNPYWNQTKGEMVAGCTNAALLKKLVPSSMSCSSPTKGRWKGLGVEHCGYCVPCLIRRAAVAKAWGRAADRTPYTLKSLAAHPLDTREAPGQQIRSFQVALTRLKKNPGIEKILIHKPGSLRDEPGNLAELAAVYRRGMEEVGKILTRVATRPS